MPRRKRSVSPNFESMDDDFDDDLSSNESRSNNNNQPPIQRNAANARERARMRVLSSAFCRLKTKLPWVPSDTKLSKLDTLRLATIYIKQLNAELNGEQTTDHNNQQHQHNQQQTNDHNHQQHSNSWPFSFQNMLNNKNYNNNNDTIMKHYTSSASSTSSLESSPTRNNNNSSNVNLNPSSTQWMTNGTLSRNIHEQQSHPQQQPTSPTLQRQSKSIICFKGTSSIYNSIVNG